MLKHDKLFGGSINLFTVTLVLLGVWFMYMAFAVVRVLAFFLLFHMLQIALLFVLVVIAVVAWLLHKREV